MTRPTFDRRLFLETLIAHARSHPFSDRCDCGWHVSGRRYSEHLADEYEAELARRQEANR